MDESVEVWRLFALPDGTSSMEQVTVKLEGGRSRLLGGTGVQIVSMAPNNEVTWHVGPRRQIICTIAGEGELETGDGQKLTVKPGIITRIDDLTGKGHITRIGPQGRLCVFMPLDTDTQIG